MTFKNIFTPAAFDTNEMIEAVRPYINGAIEVLSDERIISEVLEYSPMFIYNYSEVQQLSIHGAKNVCRYFQSKLKYRNGRLRYNINPNTVDSEISDLYYNKTFAEIDEATNANKKELVEYIIDNFNKDNQYSLFDDMDKINAFLNSAECLDETIIDTIYDAITEALYKQLKNWGHICGAHYQQYNGPIIDNEKKAA